MRNAMVAQTALHAVTMILWLKLDPHLWVPLIYGASVDGVYQHAKLIRPSEGIQQWHCDWVMNKLVPRLTSTVTTIPKTWKVPPQE